MRTRRTAERRRTTACGGHEALETAELLDRCRGGDQAAWTVLVERFERLVYSIPLKQGLGREDAADVAQLTFSALLESIDRITAPESLGWWLATVARRAGNRVLDRRLREIASVTEDIDVSVGPEDEQLAQAIMVHEGLAKLSAPCRDLLTSLFAGDEQSYVAVARALGKPVGSIGPMRARCLGRLRDLIEDSQQHHERGGLR